MSIESHATPEDNNKVRSIPDVLALKQEIENGAQFFEIRETLEGPITIENLEDYQMSFENLVDNYYKQEGNGVPDDEVERVYQLGKQKIKTLTDILDGLIELYYLKNPNLNKALLYEKGDIEDLMNKLGFNKTQLLDQNLFVEIESNISEALNNNLDLSDNKPGPLLKNSIQRWDEDLDSANITHITEPENENNSLDLLKTIVKLKNTKITSENFGEFKDDLFSLITIIDNIPIDIVTAEIIRSISTKFFDVVLIKNILLNLYPENELNELLKIHQDNNKENAIIFDNSYFELLKKETGITPDIHNIFMEEDEKTILSYLEKFFTEIKRKNSPK